MTFLVDGLNLHFSVRQAEAALGNPHLRWLDVPSLLRSYLSVFARDARLEEIHFFTAVPVHLHRQDPKAVLRHRMYLRALEAQGANVHVAHFKRRTIICRGCGQRIDFREEKETDVALGVKAIELLFLRACDALVIVSGDTDFAPALRTSRRLFPAATVCVAFPHARFNAELQQVADMSFRIRASRYAHHQLPNPVEGPGGELIRKPPEW